MPRAMPGASRGSSVRRWSAIAQPTMRREKMSTTAARNTQPSQVQMQVVSVTKTRFSAAPRNPFAHLYETGRMRHTHLATSRTSSSAC
jgi:hypothetical protein